MKTRKLFYIQLFFVGILMLFFTSCKDKNAENPLIDTQWGGIAKIPTENEIILKFSKDQMDVIFENKVVEVTKYTMKGNEINFTKISGNSPCEVNAKGKYTYEIIGDKLTITAVTDECVARTNSLKGGVYTKIDIAK